MQSTTCENIWQKIYDNMSQKLSLSPTESRYVADFVVRNFNPKPSDGKIAKHLVDVGLANEGDAAKLTETRSTTDPMYASLRDVLERAYEQAAVGKGKDRHATLEAFHEQPMQKIQSMVGPGFALGQSIKKVQESSRMEPERAVHELLGAINYIAGAIVHLESTER